MTYRGHKPHQSKWRSHHGTKTLADKKQVQTKDGASNQWRKRVEMASEFAVSEVFSHKKPGSGINNRVVSLLSSEQLKDHDDSYGEAQALLSDWMESKLRQELKTEEEEEDDDDEDDPTPRRRPPRRTSPQMNYDNFNDLYNCLTEDEESSTINNFLQGLMERQVLSADVMQELAQDVGQSSKKCRDPRITIETRHQQVRENRARRDAERLQQQKEKEAQCEAREEARRRYQEEEARRRQEERRQEDLVQQEMARLRRQMEGKRHVEQQARHRERKRMEGQRSAIDCRSPPTLSTTQQQQQQQKAERLHREQRVQNMAHMSNLKRHFSGWLSVILERRLRIDKLLALSDWRRKLRTWRAWRTVVWSGKKQRELERTEAELRAENRKCQLAAECDRKRLLRRCLSEWHLWCRKERARRALTARQQETHQKMAALICAASTGRLKTAPPSPHPPAAAVAVASPDLPKIIKKEHHHRSGSLAPDACAAQRGKTSAAQPAQPWQVTRRHAAPTAAKVQVARQRSLEGRDGGDGDSGGGGGGGGGGGDDGAACSKGAASRGSWFENRHAVQQQIIAQQRKQLKEQEERITQMKEGQSVKGLEEEEEVEMERSAQRVKRAEGERVMTVGAESDYSDVTEYREEERVTAESDSQRTPSRKCITPQTHPIVTAMEARARQRAERRKEIEEFKRKKEEEKHAELRAAEEQRQREEEEEKRQALEKRREKKRLEREREEEKQRQVKHRQDQAKLACQHHERTLLLHCGLEPWKRFMQLVHDNAQLAHTHYNRLLLKRCTLRWLTTAREIQCEREAAADRLLRYFLLQRGFNCWKRLMARRLIQEERADCFYRTHTLRRFLLALLNHVTQERLLQWRRLDQAVEHDNRRVLRRCFLAWRRLPSVMRQERERAQQRQKLLRKVAEVLPDFCLHPR